jgi:NAD(P)H dehydrogenase (quinone)
VSDLYAMRFDPVSDRRNFTTIADSSRLRQQSEEAYASLHQGFVPELSAEIEKLMWCELLLLQFPIWWLGMPAILKGWIDRVFAVGQAYGGGRYFDTGRMAGKLAMCSVTVGGLERDYDGSGAYQSIDTVLYPIHRGILAFTGFNVLPPFVAYGPGRIDEQERSRYLARFRERLGMI